MHYSHVNLSFFFSVCFESGSEKHRVCRHTSCEHSLLYLEFLETLNFDFKNLYHGGIIQWLISLYIFSQETKHSSRVALLMQKFLMQGTKWTAQHGPKPALAQNCPSYHFPAGLRKSGYQTLVEKGAIDLALLSRSTLEPGQKAWPRRPTTPEEAHSLLSRSGRAVCPGLSHKPGQKGLCLFGALTAALLPRFVAQTGTKGSGPINTQHPPPILPRFFFHGERGGGFSFFFFP